MAYSTFLNLRIPYLRFTQDLTDEVDWALNLLDVAFLIFFSNDSSADHVRCCRDVEQQWFFGHGWDQHGRVSQELFELIKGLLCFRCPLELVLLLQEPVQGHFPFPELGNKMAECYHAAC